MVSIFTIVKLNNPLNKEKMTKQATFLKQLNDAFAKGDTDYIKNQVTDDISWEMVGDFSISGKEAFNNSLKEMEGVETLDMQIDHTIIQDKTAAVNGTMKIKEASGNSMTFGFCDIYEFVDSDDLKVNKMISYVKPILKK
jgi:hypothetical protein